MKIYCNECGFELPILESSTDEEINVDPCPVCLKALMEELIDE